MENYTETVLAALAGAFMTWRQLPLLAGDPTPTPVTLDDDPARPLEGDRVRLLVGDAAELDLEPETIDALVTDPPAGIGFMGRDWDSDKGGRDEWIAWLAETLAPAFRALKPGAHGLVWALPRTSHWTALALERCGFEIRDRVSHLFGTGFPKSLDVSKAIDDALGAEREVVGNTAERSGRTIGLGTSGGYHGDIVSGHCRDITAPATPEAARWDGWGTALKPACEDWWLVRKPIAGTIARNVLTYGVGGLNVDGCRIAGGERELRLPRPNQTPGVALQVSINGSVAAGETTLGRWPAHVTLDPEAAAMLDAMSGVRTSGDLNGSLSRAGYVPCATEGAPRVQTTRSGDSGGASRFFFCAKPSRFERGEGCESLPQRSAGEATARVDGSDGLNSPRAGAGRTGGAKNFHPTVKSIALMRWLVRLITPPGGTVLDPFTGSGSTGVAAILEGFGFLGCEQSPDYAAIAKHRIRRAMRAYNREGGG